MHLSIELFPPADAAGRKKLLNLTRRMSRLSPDYFSVTYGAGSSARGKTFATVKELAESGLNVVPHLSMGVDGDSTAHDLLQGYSALGIRKILALRGDGGADRVSPRYAVELVGFIRHHYDAEFQIQVAAYPESHPDSSTPEADLRWFKQKVDAGANAAITQYFYNCDAYENFCERCVRAGINIPVIPGVMPITNHDRLVNFSKKCGAEIPLWILKQMEQYKDDLDSLCSFGVDVVTSMCERLRLLKVPAIHFYSMNQDKAVTKICTNLGLVKES